MRRGGSRSRGRTYWRRDVGRGGGSRSSDEEEGRRWRLGADRGGGHDMAPTERSPLDSIDEKDASPDDASSGSHHGRARP